MLNSLFLFINFTALIIIGYLLTSKFKKHQNQLKKLNSELDKLNDNDQTSSIEKKIIKIDEELSELKNIKLENHKSINDIIKRFRFLKDSIFNFEKDIKEISKELEDLKKIKTELYKKDEDKKETIEDISKVKRHYLINDFVIEENNIILFQNQNNLAEIFNKIENLSEIEAFLKNNQNQSSQIYSKNIDSYLKKITRFKNKYKNKNIDKDEFSEILTSEFISILEDYFVTKFLPSIYRGCKIEVKEFHKQLLMLVKRYLEKLGVFSALKDKYQIGNKITDDMWTEIEPFIVKTKTEDKHETIKEIEMFPYYMKFYNDYEEIEKFSIKGKMTIYSKNKE